MSYREMARRLAELEQVYQPAEPEPTPDDARESWAWAADALRCYVDSRGGFRFLSTATAAYEWHEARREKYYGYRTGGRALEIVREVEALCRMHGEPCIRALPYTGPVLDLLADAKEYLIMDGLYEL